MKKVLMYNNKYALVDDDDFERVNQHKWLCANNYAVSRHEKPVLIMSRFITNCPKGMYVDHVNHNTLDNRKENLRICTPRQNSCNRTKQKRISNYPYKGISICGRKYDKYRGCLAFNVNGKLKKYWSPFCDTVEEAALEYNKLAKKYYGEFACLNIVK